MAIFGTGKVWWGMNYVYLGLFFHSRVDLHIYLNDLYHAFVLLVEKLLVLTLCVLDLLWIVLKTSPSIDVDHTYIIELQFCGVL